MARPAERRHGGAETSYSHIAQAQRDQAASDAEEAAAQASPFVTANAADDAERAELCPIDFVHISCTSARKIERADQRQ